jgi:hypothetical protein
MKNGGSFHSFLYVYQRVYPLFLRLVRLDHHPNYWGKEKDVPNHQPDRIIKALITNTAPYYIPIISPLYVSLEMLCSNRSPQFQDLLLALARHAGRRRRGVAWWIATGFSTH